MKIVDEAGVRIKPDDTGFAARLRAELAADLEKATRGLRKDVTVRVKADVDNARAQVVSALHDMEAAEKALNVAEQDLNKTRVESRKLNDALDQAQERHLASIERLDLATRGLSRTEDDHKEILTEYAEQAIKVQEEEERLRQARESGSLTANQLASREELLQRERDKGWKIADRLELSEDKLSRARITVRNATQQALRSEASGFEIRDKATAAARGLHDAEVALSEAHQRSGAAAEEHARTERVLGAEMDKAVRRIESHRSALGRATSAVGNFIKSERDVAAVIRVVKTAMADTNTEFDRIGPSSGRVENGLRRVALSARSVRDGLSAVRNAVRSFGDDSETSGGRFERSFARVRTTGRGIGTDLRRGFSAAAEGASALGRVVSNVGAALTSAGGSASDMSGQLGKMTGVAGTVLTTILGVQGALAKFGLIAGVVTYAVGALSAGIAAIPALALGAVAALGTIALGVDGIKKAYENGLKPALDKLKDQISDVFERKLTPAFQKLSTELLPKITDGLVDLAAQIGDTTSSLVDLVTEGQNLDKINNIISSMIAVVRDQLTPALRNIVQAFLDIGSNSSILSDIGGIFSDLINKTADWLRELNRTGEAERAVSNLRSVLASAEDLLFRLADAAIDFFNAATPGFTSLLDSIRPSESVMRKLGEAFGDAAQAAGDLIRSIPPETFEKIADAAKRLGDKLIELANNKQFQEFVQQLLDNIPRLIDGFNDFLGVIENLAAARDKVNAFFGPVTDFLDNLLRPLGLASDGFGDVADAAEDAGPRIPPPIQQGVDGATTALQPLPGTAAAIAQGTADGLTGPLQPIPGQVGQVFGDTAAQTGQLQPLPGTAAAIASGTADGITGPLQPIPGQVGLVFSDTNAQGAKLAPLPATVGAAATAAGQAVVDGLQPMPPAADSAFSGVVTAGDKLAPLSATVGAAGTAAGQAVVDGLQPMPPGAEAQFQAVNDAARTNLDAAAASAQAGAQRISDSIRTGVQGAADAAQSGFGRVSEAVRIGMDQAAAAAEGGGGRLRDAVTQACQQAADQAQTGMARVSEAVRIGMDQAASAAQSGGSRISQAVTTGLNQAATGTTVAMARVSSAVSNGMDQAASAATAGSNRIRASITAGFTGVTSAVTSAMSRVTSVVTSGMNQAAAAATSGANRIRTVMQQASQQIVAQQTSAWNQIVAIVTAGGARAAAAAQSAAQRIVQAFRSQEGAMYSAGSALIQRLTAGMIAQGAAATAAAARIAASIKAQFPSSPAKEGPLSGRGDPLLSGGTIVERLAEGMNRTGPLRSALAGVTGLVRDAFAASDPGLSLSRSTAAALSGTRVIASAQALTPPTVPTARVIAGPAATTTSQAAPDGAGLLEELRAQTGQLRQLRGDTQAAGSRADVVALLAQIADALAGDDASRKTQGLRRVGALGQFG